MFVSKKFFVFLYIYIFIYLGNKKVSIYADLRGKKMIESTDFMIESTDFVIESTDFMIESTDFGCCEIENVIAQKITFLLTHIYA